jgi:hypothetical protein
VVNEIPSRVSKSFIALNPHLYGTGSGAEPTERKNVSLGGAAAKGAGLPVPIRKSVEERLNKTERRWLAVLRERAYERIGIQDVTLRLANGVRYTSDFSAVTKCEVGRFLTLYECKGGFEREDSWIKLKMAASQFPVFRFVKAQWKDGQWTETEIKP